MYTDKKPLINLQQGSIELVVLGLLAALIVVLAFPLFLDPTSSDKADEHSSASIQSQQETNATTQI